MVTRNVAISYYLNSLLTLLKCNQFLEVGAASVEKSEKENLLRLICGADGAAETCRRTKCNPDSSSGSSNTKIFRSSGGNLLVQYDFSRLDYTVGRIFIRTCGGIDRDGRGRGIAFTVCMDSRRAGIGGGWAHGSGMASPGRDLTQTEAARDRFGISEASLHNDVCVSSGVKADDRIELSGFTHQRYLTIESREE
ncbi:hypothetical protein BGZ98_001576 [Dissophora globulifera]|nr:hypothetical protein BGZ98_001576 [Dissophora globulifera]